MSEKKYSKIQMIGLAISTTPGDLRSIEETSDDGRYLGFEDFRRDISARLDFLRQAIEQAYEMHDKSGDVLKVFTVPEFFFRGNKGAYYGDSRNFFVNYFGHFVSEYLSQEKFADWLFILGTLLTSKSKIDAKNEPTKSLIEVGGSLVSIYNRLHPKSSEIVGNDAASEVASLSDFLKYLDEKENIDPNVDCTAIFLNSTEQARDSDYLNILSASLNYCDSIANIDVYNCCYIVEGGSSQPTVFSVQKKHKSKEDFILKGPDDNYLQTTTRYPNIPDGSEVKRLPNDPYSVFTYHGIKFGIEICLDHGRGRLVDAYRQHNGQLVDVQIIVSCGMNIRNGSVVAVKDGIVFNCDGEYVLDNAENGEHCHTILQTVKKTADKQSAAILYDYIKLDSDSKKKFEYTADLYSCKSYQIHVYKPIDLPKDG